MRGWKKIFHANGNQKKAGVAILISDKIDFKIKNVTRDKEGHYIMIKGSIQEEDITIINIYAPKKGEPQYIRQLLTAIKDTTLQTSRKDNPRKVRRWKNILYANENQKKAGVAILISDKIDFKTKNQQDTGTPKFRAALLTRTPTSLHLKYPRKEKNG